LLSSRSPSIAVFAFAFLCAFSLAGQNDFSEVGHVATEQALRKSCGVDAAESSGDLAEMNAALACINAAKQRAREATELKKRIERSLRGTQSGEIARTQAQQPSNPPNPQVQVATPTFTPPAGAVDPNTSVTLVTTTPGAAIYYTLDGKDPTANSTQYTKPISVTPPITVKAIAIGSDNIASAIATAQYTASASTAPSQPQQVGPLTSNGQLALSETILASGEGENVTPATAVPASGTPGTTPPVPVAGQDIQESAYNTPSACDPDISTATNATLKGVIAVHRDLLVPKEASDDFGYRLGKRFIIYKVSVTNLSTTFQYSVADISIDLKDILSLMGFVPVKGGKYPRFLASGHDLSLLRGVPEKGQDYDPRNMTLHIFQGVGSVAAGISGLTPFSDVMGPATANFSGAFLQAFTGIAPDHTATQLNRLSDMAFSPNSLIDKLQTKTYAVFIPESLLLEEYDQDLFWKNPRQLLNLYPFDQVNVCVDGQLLTPAPTTTAPTFSLDSGNVSPTTTITLTASGADAIYYTTNGDTPTTSSTKYASPIKVNPTIGSTMTIQAFASGANQVQSPTESRSYTTQPQAATPTIAPPAGAMSGNTSVTIATTTTPGAKIYYTIDGTDPSVNSTLYTGPISVTPPLTLKAIAISPATSASPIATAQFTATTSPPLGQAQAATPTFAPPAGAVTPKTRVALASTTPEAKIYYTIDGTDPSVKSTLYTGPISVTPPLTLKAIAISSATLASQIGTAQYTNVK
jgi:Chitobiase/beta-hexosaminidase C-terminal domain